MELTWLEISKQNLVHNFNEFKNLIGDNVTLAPVIKGNAYGHGLVQTAKIFSDIGAEYLCVNTLDEVIKIRNKGITTPLLILGYVPKSDLKKAVRLNADLTVYNPDTLWNLGRSKKPAKIHLKIETGSNRQGVLLKDLSDILDQIAKYQNIRLIGVSTQFANLERRLHPTFAFKQLERFEKALSIIEEKFGILPRYIHSSNTATTLAMPEARFNFVRVGTGCYGYWPSKKTRIRAKREGVNVDLKPALTWKAIVAQIKDVKKGSAIGYGATHKMAHSGQIAIVTTGYCDGYLSEMSNSGYVIIKGKRCKVLGKVNMNMIMVDVSHIKNLQPEDQVTLLGSHGKSKITLEHIQRWTGQVPGKILTAIDQDIKRSYL